MCRICWVHRDLLVQDLQSGTVLFVDLLVLDLQSGTVLFVDLLV